MRIRKAVSALSIALLLGAMTPARSQEQDAKKNLDSSASSAMQKRVIVGVVKDYEAGKSLTVTTRDKDVEMFKLDDTNINLQLNTSLIVGQAVKIVESTDSSGKRSLTIDAQKYGEPRK